MLGEDPARLVFGRSPEGKPWLFRAPGAPGLAFNLSHSGTLAALAVAPPGLDTGVDVEAHRDGRRFEALARRYFSTPEQGALSADGPEGMAGNFYDTWTLKEAWLKARGSGIRVPLADFGFHRNGASLSFSAAPALDSRPSDWRFWCWRLGRQASLSLAIRDPGRVSGEPRIHHGLPLGNWDPLAPEARAASDW